MVVGLSSITMPRHDMDNVILLLLRDYGAHKSHTGRDRQVFKLSISLIHSIHEFHSDTFILIEFHVRWVR